MRADQLPSPGTYSGSHQLRHQAAKAISAAEIAARHRGSPSEGGIKLAAMFQAAAQATPGWVPPTPTLPDDQAIVSDGDVLTVTGGTVTLSVADGVVTATYTAD